MSNTRSYFIIGCGHFGGRAAEQLLKRDPHSKIIAIDKNAGAAKKLSHLPIETIVDDGLSYLERFLSEGRRADYIIPAVPFHLAYEFILLGSRPRGAKRVKIPPLSGLPNPEIGKTGDLYTSFADFLCPEDCPEPAQYCTITKQKRPRSLYHVLEDLEGPFESRVIHSRQLAPGVGGYSPAALLDLSKNIKKRMEPHRTILISTSCRCHGVTSALSFSPNKKSRAPIDL